MRTRWCELGVALVVVLAVAASAGTAAAAADGPAPRLDAMVRYLQQQQGQDGGFPGDPGGTAGAGFTAWAALALAGAGINPQDQAAPGGQSAFGYLVAHAGALTFTTDFERELLVVDAAGTSPRDFAGTDLVAEILARQLTDGPEAGAFAHEPGRPEPGVNDTIFAILALSPIHEEAVSRAVALALKWLVKVQNVGEPKDGGGSWPSVTPDTVTDKPEDNVEMTGAAIQALNAAGMHESAAQGRALEFLHQAEQADGGFPEKPGEAEANVASTAWAVQGIWAAGEDPKSWQREGHDPLGYMESMQRFDGSLQFDAGSYENPVWMTAYAGLAFAGAHLPLAAVPRREDSETPPPAGEPAPGSGAAAAPAGEHGQGGVEAYSGSGVIAGGGGLGAQAFSRPRAQSKGHTPGGVRQLTAAPRGAQGHRGAGADASAADGAAPSSSGAEAGSGGSAALGQAVAGAGGTGAVGSGGETVRGVLLGDSLSAFHSPLAGAPGLRGAGAGGDQSPWPAIVIALGAVGLALLGARVERRRPRAVL